ncbi:MAG: hypothetical protein IPP49_20920 [Saprospiraceae bacterium]|nr:hypothetical protein [Saprospiraceae bacterium]
MGIKTSKTLIAPPTNIKAYHPEFLGSRVDVPKLSNTSVAYKLDGTGNHRLHPSLLQCTRQGGWLFGWPGI